MDWAILPYSHSYEKNQPSIFAPGTKVTFVQFLSECIIYNRQKYIKTFPRITIGEGWSRAISRQVRGLVQQMHTICNYFPHYQQEQLVSPSFKNTIRTQRTLKVGQHRKNRVTKTGKINITQDEKDFVLAVQAELGRLIKQRESLINVVNKNPEQINSENVTFRGLKTQGQKKSLKDLIILENKDKNV